VDIVQLDKGNDWERMSLRLRYSVTLAAAAIPSPMTKKGDGFGPLSLFQLVAGSGEPIWSCSGHRLRKLAEHWRGNRADAHRHHRRRFNGQSGGR
jgi:hypothetical protein